MRHAVGGVGEVDPRQALDRDPAGLGLAHAQVQRAERHVLDDRRAEELVVGVLEQQADPAADLGRVPRVDLQAVDPDAGPRRRAPAPSSSAPWACTRTGPALPGRRPLRCSRSVLLPAPLGPTRATVSPGMIVRSTPAEREPAVGIAVRTGRAHGRTGRGSSASRRRFGRRTRPSAVGHSSRVRIVAVPAPGDHRGVDPLAALQRAEEQDADQAGEQAPVEPPRAAERPRTDGPGPSGRARRRGRGGNGT